MSAYLTFTCKKTLDVTELKVYWDKIRATFAGHRVKVLVNSWNGGVHFAAWEQPALHAKEIRGCFAKVR